jgi:hypothetical protein
MEANTSNISFIKFLLLLFLSSFLYCFYARALGPTCRSLKEEMIHMHDDD